VQNEGFVFRLHDLEQMRLEERLKIAKGAEPLVNWRLSLRLGVVAIPILWPSKGLILFGAHGES
jgi:hypothetical protein